MEPVVRFNSYKELIKFLRKSGNGKFQESPSENITPDKKKLEVINGLVEISNENGNYLQRICDNALEADIYEHKVIVVKNNGDLLLYSEFGNFIRELTNDVSSARIQDGIILVTKRNGETGTCDFDGVYFRNN